MKISKYCFSDKFDIDIFSALNVFNEFEKCCFFIFVCICVYDFLAKQFDQY